MNNNMKLFDDFNIHLLNDDIPSVYFNSILNAEPLIKKYPFSMLYDLLSTPQSPIHHPEGSVWNHTMIVIDLASQKKSQSIDKRTFMWAALLHDIGKAPTTKVRKGKITSYDHDKIGEIMSVKFLNEFTDDTVFIKKVSSLIRWHMQPLFILKNLPFADIKSMLSEVSPNELSLLSLCDRLGRGDMTQEKISEEKKAINSFLNKCLEYTPYNSKK